MNYYERYNVRKLYDKGDFCLRASLFSSALFMQGRKEYASKIMSTMENECKPTSIFHARKSSGYRWSNSGSENPKENTFFKRPTYWLYQHILKYIGLDPHKGLNGDQYRAYFVYLFLTKQRMKCIKILLGFLMRLGFFPSLFDHVLFKPQTIVLLLATICKPLKYIVYPFYLYSEYSSLKESIESGTTNKISLLFTMLCLKRKLPPISYIEKVYTTYFHEELSFMATGIDKAFIEYTQKSS